MRFSEDGPYRFGRPRGLSACRAVSFGEAMGSCLSGAKEIISIWRVSRGHVSAQQLKRALGVSDGEATHLAGHVDAVLAHCNVCRAFHGAPRVPIPGTYAVSTFT